MAIWNRSKKKQDVVEEDKESESIKNNPEYHVFAKVNQDI